MREGLPGKSAQRILRIAGAVKRVYLDYNATTPVHPAVAEFVKPLIDERFGNPSSLHWAGRDARSYFEEARQQLAYIIGAKPDEIILGSGGTEGANHAIKGVAGARVGSGSHIITTAVEHPAVLNTCRYLEGKGFKVSYLPVDSVGVVDPDDVRRAITKETILISVMYANNETGTLMPVGEIGRIARERGILFHSDMVQALGKVEIDVDALNVDLASFSSHKVYALKGSGMLYVRGGLDIDSLIHGGHQEGDRRAGTENVVGTAAFGKACEIMRTTMASQNRRIETLRTRLLEGIRLRVAGVELNGHPTQRLPNTLNLSFQYVEAESLLISLDLKGVAISAGSACASGAAEPSHVLVAMGIPPLACQSTVRLSLGIGSTDEDVDYCLEVLPALVDRLREMSPLRER